MTLIEPDVLLAAYATGYFPMADSREGAIRWYSPERRGILRLEDLKISRSLRQTLRKHPYTLTINAAFRDVMYSCSARPETWISGDIIESYCALHRLRFAHSIEVWKGDRLAGGLYGVALGGAFFGESMFSRERDASKVALVTLVDRLMERGFELLDTQFLTEHLARMGAVEISRPEYLRLLQHALVQERTFP